MLRISNENRYLCTDTHVRVEYLFDKGNCELIQPDKTKTESALVSSAGSRAYNCVDVNITVFGYLTQEFIIVQDTKNVVKGSCDLYRM